MATITVLTSRNTNYVDLNVWEEPNSGNTSTNKSKVNYSVVIRRGTKSWDTSWASWGQKIFASISIDYFGSKNIYIPTYNYGGECPPGTVVDSGSFEVEHDSAGNRTINFSLSFTDNADGNNNGSYYTPGDASAVYGSVALANIPRYTQIYTFTISQDTETQVKGNWSVDSNVSVAHCRHREKGTSTWSSWNQVAWPNFNYGGLAAGKKYEFQLKVKSQASGLETESGVVEQTTHNYPYVTSTPDFVIGDTLTLKIHNPIKRNCTFYLIGNNGEEIGGAQTTGETMSGYTGEDVKNLLYRGIPNSQSGRYSVRLVVDSVGRNTTTQGGTYYIRGDEKPTFTEANIIEVVDTLLADEITGNNTKIIKGHNVLSGKITPMTPLKSAGGSRYVINANANPSSQEITYATNNKEFILRNITTNSFSVTAYDTRGLFNPATEYITLIDYSAPIVKSLLINRVDGVGKYASLSASGIFTHWNGWSEIKKYNTIQKVYMRYKDLKINTWTQWYDVTDKLTQNANGSWAVEYTMDFEFSNTQKYEFELYVEDLLEGSSSLKGSLSTANAFIWKDLKNKWLGIGKKPGCALDVAGDGWFDGILCAPRIFKNGKSVMVQGTISDDCDYYTHDSENVISLRYVSGSANNRPVTTTGMDGMILAYQPHPKYIYQLFIAGSNPVELWTRAYSDGNWKSWVKVPNREEINNINSSISTLNDNVNARCRCEYLGNNPNIDNYRWVSGTYGLYNCSKAPSTSIGILEVVCYTGDWCVQRFTEVGYGGAPAIWQRSFYSGTTWGPWHKIH